MDTKAVQPHLDAADKRREEIRNSKTEIVKSDKFIRGETNASPFVYNLLRKVFGIKSPSALSG